MLYKPMKAKPPRLHPIKQTPLRRYICDYCRIYAPDAPMLKDEVWLRIYETLLTKGHHSSSPARTLLCIPCTETLLGRPILPEDLMDCLGNQYVLRALDQYCGRLR